ncbi:MAG: AsnC family protein [Nocardia sp.]|uniref:Lrp/AsnC family transcriptional regulator n=1 Tax=Nocardia sp. TaxID=1821 RepID=UPI002631E572|nr:AsnC family transcriptional regulator [Nocardia sp.]MCU1644125.1 AsnC family protein [Nocardia sp.]
MLDELDRRIVGALQIDGRAAWSRIAAVLGEPERTVARHGNRLLESGAVTVTALAPRGDAVLVRIRCTPGTAGVCGRTLAHRPDAVFSYVLTGSVDCVAEIICLPERVADLVLQERPGIPGLVESNTLPVLRYFRTVHEWQPALLTATEAAELTELPPLTPAPTGAGAQRLGREERLIVRALAEDGRRTYDEIARIAGISEPTARRRVESLRRTGVVHIRAVVAPAALGLGVEALLWIRTQPSTVELVGRLLLESPYVRYAAVIMGDHQIVADVAVPDKLRLYELLTGADWVAHVESVETSMVIEVLKTSGVQRTRVSGR